MNYKIEYMGKRGLLQLLSLTLLLFFLSCKEEKKGGSFMMKVHPSSGERGVQVDSLDVYLDCSGSMRGYVDFVGQADHPAIKSVLPGFITQVENLFPASDIRCYGVSDNKMREYSRTEFPRKLIDGSIFTGATTELDVIIKEVTKRSSEKKVSVVVSDFVMSFGKNALKNAPFKNINDIDILKDQLAQSFTQLKSKGLAVAIVKYESDFNGKYYYNCLENSKGNPFVNVLMKERPFYLMLIGKPEYLETFYRSNCFAGAEGIYAPLLQKEPRDEQPFAVIRSKKGSSGWKVGTSRQGAGVVHKYTDRKSTDPAYVYVAFDEIPFPGMSAYMSETILAHPVPDGQIIVKAEPVSFASPEVLRDLSAYQGNPKKYLYKVTLNQDEQLKNGEGSFRFLDVNPLTGHHVMRDDTIPVAQASLLQKKTFAFHKVLEAVDHTFGRNNEIAKVSMEIEIK